MKVEGSFPATLLSTRSAIFFDESLNQTELQSTQKAFQQTGIDGVAYFEIERSLAGMDCRRAALKYLVKRDIRFLIFMRKLNHHYEFYVTTFNGKTSFIDASQTAWFIHDTSLNNGLKTIYQTAIASEKRQNFLINDLPEFVTEKEASPLVARRSEALVTDIGYFAVAFPKFGDDQADKDLENFLKENFKGKYELVNPDVDEAELRKKGFVFILRYVYTNGFLAKDILGYQTTKSESAIASTTFVNGELQLKTIPSTVNVYKYYFKKLETGEAFLGKWDADVTWQAALKNHLDAYKAEKKLK